MPNVQSAQRWGEAWRGKKATTSSAKARMKLIPRGWSPWKVLQAAQRLTCKRLVEKILIKIALNCEESCFLCNFFWDCLIWTPSPVSIQSFRAVRLASHFHWPRSLVSGCKCRTSSELWSSNRSQKGLYTYCGRLALRLYFKELLHLEYGHNSWPQGADRIGQQDKSYNSRKSMFSNSICWSLTVVILNRPMFRTINRLVTHFWIQVTKAGAEGECCKLRPAPFSWKNKVGSDRPKNTVDPNRP